MVGPFKDKTPMMSFEVANDRLTVRIMSTSPAFVFPALPATQLRFDRQIQPIYFHNLK